MYLNKLNKQQKELFLQLALKAATYNDIVDIEEALIIQSYCAEMDVQEDEVAKTMELEALLQTLKAISTKEELHVMVFEIARLLVADEHFDALEKNFIHQVQTVFEIADYKLGILIGLSKQCIKLEHDIMDAIEN